MAHDVAAAGRLGGRIWRMTMTAGIEMKMTPSHPGDFVRTEIIEELSLSVTKAAKVLGVRRATLSALLHAKAALSPEMALRIEKAFGVSMDMLMRMQAWHDTARMRAKAHEIKVQRYAAVPAQSPTPLCGSLAQDAAGRRLDCEQIDEAIRQRMRRKYGPAA